MTNCVGLCFAAFVAVGCAARQPHPTPLPPRPPAQQAQGPVAATQVFPLAARSHQLVLSRPDREDKKLAVTVEKQGAFWVMTIAGRSSMFIQKAATGDLVVMRETDLRENVRIEYQPGVVLLPAELAAGVTRQGEAHMTVYNLGTDQQREQGTCKYQIDVIGLQQVETAASPVDAWLVRTQRDMDLSLADAHVTLETAYAPQLGQVYERAHIRTVALGLFANEQSYTMKLAN